MRKKILAIVLAAAMAGTAGCGTAKTQETAADTASKAEETTGAEASESETAAKAEGTTYKIGVLQLVQHTALDAANDGFIAALDDAGIVYEVDQQNASGDQSACQTVASKFANEKKDLILAIATPAAQAMVGAVEDTPVLITAVTDPAESGLVNTNEKPGANVTGTSDLTPVKEQIDLLKQLVPEAKTVGVLYCSAESNSKIQADMAKEAIAAAGMESKEYTVSSSNEIQTVVQSMVGAVDAVYAPTDNVIAAGMATVGMVAGDNNLPVICGEAGMVQNGGLATYGIDYYQLGYMTGQQAVKILTEGASPADMPIEYLPAEKCELTVNEETAQTLGIDVSGAR